MNSPNSPKVFATTTTLVPDHCCYCWQGKVVDNKPPLFGTCGPNNPPRRSYIIESFGGARVGERNDFAGAAGHDWVGVTGLGLADSDVTLGYMLEREP